MKLVITETIKQYELLPLQEIFSFEVIRVAAKKSIQGMGVTIPSSVKIPETVLKKLSLTSSGGAGRILFLLQVRKDADK